MASAGASKTSDVGSNPAGWAYERNIMEPVNDPITWPHDDSDNYDLEKHLRERGERGFSDYDWWNFCEYNAWVMINALEKFKTGMGHPVHGEVQTMEDWVRVLTEIQEGFKAQLKMPETVTTEEYEILNTTWKRGMELLTIYYVNLWD